MKHGHDETVPTFEAAAERWIAAHTGSKRECRLPPRRTRYIVARGKLRLSLHDHGGGCTWEHESWAIWTTEFATRADAQAVIDTYARSTQRTMRIIERTSR